MYSQEALALEYLGLLGSHRATLGEAKQHVFTLCYAGLQVHTDLRGRMHKAREIAEVAEIVRELQARPSGSAGPFCNAPDAYTSWYQRHTWEWWKHEAARGVNVCKQYGDDGVLLRAGGGDAPRAEAEEPVQPWLEGLVS